MPADVDIRSRITRSIPVNIPIIASAMDTVTEAQMAIAMAQAGGIGVLHRNMEPDEQAAQVRQVKKFESGMVVNPLTIEPGCDASAGSRPDERQSHLRNSGGRDAPATRSPASWSEFSQTATSVSRPIRGRKFPS